uniref:Complement C8 alpha chain n=1 Tax=Falco tinnunculus TaxID=100819 RepID=A0A8C4V9B3_FALTI
PLLDSHPLGAQGRGQLGSKLCSRQVAKENLLPRSWEKQAPNGKAWCLTPSGTSCGPKIRVVNSTVRASCQKRFPEGWINHCLYLCTVGRCVQRHLVCNGEPDCRDGSDESNCEDEGIESPCEDLFPIPGSEKAAQGYNILTQEESQYVYDPNYFGGHCEYVYNGEWRELRYDAACERLYYGDDEKYFRKPYNFHIYQFLAHADSGFAFEFYEDSKDLLDALKSDKTRTKGFTIGIGPGKSDIQLELGFTLSGGKGSLKNFTQYTAKEVGFIRSVTKVQTARFKMRRDNIVLDEDVLLSLQELPDTYNYGMYAKFINDYGTHFMTSGTMGGVFEYILVINKEEMRRKDISAEEISACIGHSIGLTVRESEQRLEASVSSSDCAKKGFLKTGMTAGQMSVTASGIALFGHLGVEIQAGSHKGTEKGALVPSPAVAPAQLWDQRDFGSQSPGVLIALGRAGIKAAMPGLETRVHRGSGVAGRLQFLWP